MQGFLTLLWWQVISLLVELYLFCCYLCPTCFSNLLYTLNKWCSSFWRSRRRPRRREKLRFDTVFTQACQVTASIFNKWSVSKLHQTCSDSFMRARMNVLCGEREPLRITLLFCGSPCFSATLCRGRKTPISKQAKAKTLQGVCWQLLQHP